LPICPSLQENMFFVESSGEPLGTLAEGRADTELRRPYHLIAQGRAPLSEADVVTLGTMPREQLRSLLPWLTHQLSLAEATQCVARGEPAPPVVNEEL
jgi:hypothetical protein